MMTKKPGFSFFLIMFFVTLVTMLMHEGVHVLTAISLGIETFAVGLTQVRYLTPEELAGNFETQRAIISISGQIFTAALGLFGAWLAIAKRISFGYELLFVAFFQRLIAATMSMITNTHNDEARVSLFLGWDWWVLPIIFIIPLFILLIIASFRLRFGFLVFLGAYVTVSLAFTVVVAADGQLPGMDQCDGLFAPFYPEAFGCSGS